MPAKPPPSDLPTHAFPSAASFETFLEREHATAPGVFVKFAKKGSGIPSVTWAEAVEVALCFGWIDGRANSIDEKWWTVRYTPRRAKSIWSQKNVATVAKLIETGKMRPAGLAVVEAAQADGRWDRAYAGPATMTTPTDLEEALAAEPAAQAYFESLNKSQKYTVLWPLATASDKTRANKIDVLVQTMATGKMPGISKPKVKEQATLKKGVQKNPVNMKKTSASRSRVAPSKRCQNQVKEKDSEATTTPRRAGLRSRA